MSGTPAVSGAPTPAPGAEADTARAALALGDDALVLSHRLTEWAGDAPVLEEEVALANLALDLLGQARNLYAIVGDEDALAFRREEREFRNVQLVEQPNGDFAHTIARQLYFSVHRELLYAELAGADREHPRLAPIAAVAAKALPELTYHRDHAMTWTVRLGDGTAESTRRMQHAIDALWRYTGELFEPIDGLPTGLPAPTAHRETWLRRIGSILDDAKLTLPDPGAAPDRDAWAAGAGRQGLHTEPFGRMLAEMQHLHRSHPGASW
ncbi:1,2-phenylacetyl-CoA epoxidase subunit PaaC [Streptomyces sp. ST2-7A]|uniref:1,2-phenylacetyl-CoA epoxidase subunit PaaC n=1 Tax=Streptomyces sp. ST2-7A TaxID=2907214 RepID=UPI0035ABD8AA